MTELTREQMYQFYFSDPKDHPFSKIINQVAVEYFYFTAPLTILTNDNEVCNFCLLKGSCRLMLESKQYIIDQFDLVYLPPKLAVTITPSMSDPFSNKICIVKNPLLANHKGATDSAFQIQRFSFTKFIPRGAHGAAQKMATYREVWTAFKNGFFMSGFTNIPQSALVQGVVTSVNLEEKQGAIQIHPHIHPGYPEIYIYCIDDASDSIAVTQYLINARGQSIARDLIDGEGIFFDGSLGHINFTKPTYQELKYCLYLWIIPTFGKTTDVIPITLLQDR